MKLEAGLKTTVFNWKDVCKTVEFYRRSLNLSQRELARLIGVMSSTVCFWEKGTKEPKASSLVKLANLFGISERDLLHPTHEAQEWMKMNLKEP